MSIHPLVKAKDDDHGKTTHPRMSPGDAEDDAEEIRRLDAAVASLFKVVPEHPYFLSVPCSEPRYHYPSQQEAESWAKHTPFSLDEERLQYMTFLYREPSESTFVVRSQVDEERDRLAHLRRTNGTPSSTPAPLTQSVGKKKISLSAYKDKLAGKTTSPEKGNGKIEMKEVKPLNGIKMEHKSIKTEKPSSSSHGSAVTGQKRVRNDSDTSKSSFEGKAGSAPSVKKPRPSNPSLTTPQPSHNNGPPHDLPPLLSPTFPSSSWDLPPMLSPTLPAKIEAELEREAKSRSRAESNTSSSSNDKRTKSSVTSAAAPSKSTSLSHEREQPTNKLPSKPTPASSSIRKEASSKTEGGARKVSNEAKIKKADADEADHIARRADLVESEDEDERPKPRSKLIVKIKYGKKNKMHVERYLRLPPRPTREPAKPKQSQSLNADRGDADRARARSGERAEVSSKSVAPRETAKKTIPTSDRPAKQLTTPGKIEKRSRLEESDAAPVAKRQKIPASLDVEKNPQTPNRAPLISPSFHKSGGSMKSGAHLTPRADHLRGSTAMSRSGSSESVATPGGKRSYPTPLPRTGDKGPTSTPTGGRAADYQALLALSKHFNELGRKLKHSNQAIMAKPRDQITEADRKKAACLGLECILSYMLAYGLVDAGRKIDRRSAEIDTTWLTLLPLFKHLGGSTKASRALEGLRLHLGISITARIQSVLADRISRAGSTAMSAPTPASASQEGRDKSDSPHDPFSTSTSSTKDQTMLAENYTQLARITREARSKLPAKEIISTFPRTWDKSASGVMEGEETLMRDGGADCKGKFWLPVSIDTTPVQAVRFGLYALEEWVKKEGLEYEVQVKL